MKFCLCQQLFAFKEFYMEARLENGKWKTLKQPASTFDIQIEITLAIFREKMQPTHFRKPTEVSGNSSKFISIGPPITK